jgi:hypothetical protein
MPERIALRLAKRLLINGRPVALASDYVRLELSEVGAGIFELLEHPPQLARALVELYAAVGEGQEYLVFTGAVRETRELAPGRLRVDVVELSTVLNMTLVLNMMHATPREVVAKIERTTGLRFLLPAGEDYLDERRVVFQHYGTCRSALEAAAKKWEVDDAVWFQLPDGRMYWGHWTLGPYTKAPLPIRSDLIVERDNVRRTLVLPYIPALRPGMVVQSDFRFRIDSLVFSDDTTRVTWREV